MRVQFSVRSVHVTDDDNFAALRYQTRAHFSEPIVKIVLVLASVVCLKWKCYEKLQRFGFRIWITDRISSFSLTDPPFGK
jgi:hypothetical protein